MKRYSTLQFAIVLVCALASQYPASTSAQTETVIYSFCTQTGCADGNLPKANLINVKGRLYGTTEGGGAYGIGTVFSLNPTTGTEKVLHSFGGNSDGSHPDAGVLNIGGTFYGTTIFGGVYDSGDAGTVFTVNKKTGAETVLHSFGKGKDGINPTSSLINVNGILYGTTQEGGSSSDCAGGGCGTVFSIDPSTGAETVVYSFCGQKNCADGSHVYGGLINVNGTLYGETAAGGTKNFGTLFALDPSTGSETVVHSFTGNPDGYSPESTLIVSKGVLYGTTYGGGTNNAGTVFAFDPETGTETMLHSFNPDYDGVNPLAGLVLVKGTLYGTTYFGGANGYGTAFGIDKTTGTEKMLYTFCSQKNCADGAAPEAGLINVNGTLYGTTFEGGAAGNGTVFALVP